jgi:hypothetical protein
VCARVIWSGVGLLIAAVLHSLFIFPAAAHSGHGHDAAVSIIATAPDGLVDRESAGDVAQDDHLIVAYAAASLSSPCWCGRTGSSMGCGCGCGMACGSGSCGHASGVLTSWRAVDVELPAKGVGCLSSRLLAGYAPGPDERPPRT